MGGCEGMYGSGQYMWGCVEWLKGRRGCVQVELYVWGCVGPRELCVSGATCVGVWVAARVCVGVGQYVWGYVWE